MLVIGAGAAGLAVARALRDAGIKSFIVAERRSDVGGLWNYRSKTGEINAPPDGVTFEDCGASPMYNDLTTNLPKALMAFHDHPFPDEVPDLPDLPRTAVLEYLRGFADAHGLRAHVEFETVVEQIQKEQIQKDADAGVWQVTTSSHRGGLLHRKTRTFRFVAVANGHFASPMLPRLQGLESFPGRVMHSCSFDRADEFDGKSVLIMGGSASAGDLAKQILRRKSSAVYISVRQLPQTMARKLVFFSVLAAEKEGAQLCGAVSRLTADGTVEFADGTSKAVDVVICATGYTYSFRFLDAASVDVIGSDGSSLKGLYRGLVYAADPTLFFIGMHNVILGPNQVFEAQARLVARIVRDGPASVLPVCAVMQAEEREREEPGDSKFLGLQTGAYCEELSALAGVPCTYTGPPQAQLDLAARL